MYIIRKKCREADILAARFYKLAAGDRHRAARDWKKTVKEASDLVNQLQKCRKHSASNKGYFTVTSKNVENVEANVEAGTVGIID